MRRCESCGKVYSDDRDIICPHCGAVALKKCSGNSHYDSKYSESRDEKYRYDEELLENDARYEKNGKSINIPSFKMPNMKNGKFKKVCVVLIVAVLLYSVIVPIFNVAFENITYPDYTETVAADDSVHCDAYVARSVSDADSGKFALYIKPYRSTDASIYNFEDSPFLVFELSECVDDAVEFEYGVSLQGRKFSGVYEFQFEDAFDADCIILIEDVSIEYEYEEFSLKLPFDAFSCDEEGYITYYALASKEENSATVEFEEIEIDLQAFDSVNQD